MIMWVFVCVSAGHSEKWLNTNILHHMRACKWREVTTSRMLTAGDRETIRPMAVKELALWRGQLCGCGAPSVHVFRATAAASKAFARSAWCAIANNYVSTTRATATTTKTLVTWKSCLTYEILMCNGVILCAGRYVKGGMSFLYAWYVHLSLIAY